MPDLKASIATDRYKRVEAIPLKIPFTHGGPSVSWAGSDWQALEIVLVRLQTDSGLVGWGEAFSYNCRRAVVAMIEDSAANVLADKLVSERAQIMHELQVGMHLWGRYGISMFAISGIDIALWDLTAKAADQSLGQMLGGNKKILPAFVKSFHLPSKKLSEWHVPIWYSFPVQHVFQ